MKNSAGKNPTIYEVAQLAGVSIATVSRVLNLSDKVQEATREKVLNVIDEIGYVPAAEVRARSIRHTRRIGVLTPYFTAPGFVERLRGIAFALGTENYELVIYTVDSKQRLEAQLASLALTRRLDGLIILSLPITHRDAQRLVDHHVNVVIIEHDLEMFSCVKIDNFAGGKIAAKYLSGKGHRQMGFIGEINTPDYAIRPALERLNGFKQGLAEQRLLLPEDNIRSSPIDQKSSLQASRELLSLEERPTAIFTAADIQALAVIKAAKELGLRVPQEIAVLGFDDIEIANYVGLTTIRQSLDEIGRIAAELLLSQLFDSGRSVQHVSLPLTIVERETV